jgi:hypothetical protein
LRGVTHFFNATVAAPTVGIAVTTIDIKGGTDMQAIHSGIFFWVRGTHLIASTLQRIRIIVSGAT